MTLSDVGELHMFTPDMYYTFILACGTLTASLIEGQEDWLSTVKMSTNVMDSGLHSPRCIQVCTGLGVFRCAQS